MLGNKVAVALLYLYMENHFSLDICNLLHYHNISIMRPLKGGGKEKSYFSKSIYK